MGQALREAARAAAAGEVPAGCVIVARPENPLAPPLSAHVLARAHNQTELLKDPTAHAEMIAITQAAAAVRDWRLVDTILYVTKEPCPMCAGAIVLARIPVVVYGLTDPQRGGALSVFPILNHPAPNHHPTVITGVGEAACRDLLQGFFRERRASAVNSGQ